MTQFEMMTSTDASGNGIASISPFRNSTVRFAQAWNTRSVS